MINLKNPRHIVGFNSKFAHSEKNMNWRKLLFPLSGLYWLGVSMRNLAFSLGILSSKDFQSQSFALGIYR